MFRLSFLGYFLAGCASTIYVARWSLSNHLNGRSPYESRFSIPKK